MPKLFFKNRMKKKNLATKKRRSI